MSCSPTQHRKGAIMMFVRVLEAGVWGRAPVHANADFEKTLVDGCVPPESGFLSR